MKTLVRYLYLSLLLILTLSPACEEIPCAGSLCFAQDKILLTPVAVAPADGTFRTQALFFNDGWLYPLSNVAVDSPSDHEVVYDLGQYYTNAEAQSVEVYAYCPKGVEVIVATGLTYGQLWQIGTLRERFVQDIDSIDKTVIPFSYEPNWPHGAHYLVIDRHHLTTNLEENGTEEAGIDCAYLILRDTTTQDTIVQDTIGTDSTKAGVRMRSTALEPSTIDLENARFFDLLGREVGKSYGVPLLIVEASGIKRKIVLVK